MNFPKHVLLEEEDGGGGGGGYYAYPPKNKSELIEWWKDSIFSSKDYPIYAFFVGWSSDIELVGFIEKQRNFIKEVSGKSCCFIYFRNEEHAKSLKEWEINEHFVLARELSRLLGYTPDFTPHIIFFEDITSLECISFSLKNKNQVEITEMFNNLFTYFYDNTEVQKTLKILDDYKKREVWLHHYSGFITLLKKIIPDFLKVAVKFIVGK